MKKTALLFSVTIFVAIWAATLPLARAYQNAFATAKAKAAAQSKVQQVPAYHSAAPKGALPSTLPAHNFTDPLTKKAYGYAAKIKPVLYQLPCYCHCDQAVGHTSLLSCYRDQHGAECEVCKKELFYAYEQNRGGKTAPQIRAGIIRGEWQKVDLAKYAPPSVSGRQ
ncbi:MAG TPA: CYCXC family (seleno)protein [Candidatus Acidoferrales bacterium]|nr:CYCXC family (seleno)protein [Candidatus Acidoferrales bacterium]